ncbi:hypothetical protein BJV82DRAFT_637430 [Fennellomyces sp. T-0311]|nr:hypothetical protein BJV82DRAFT_637430 [Fennellomyces sp. T-0311]
MAPRQNTVLFRFNLSFIMLSREQRKEIKEVFAMVDTIGAGLLDGEALYKALRALGLEVPVAPAGIEDLLRTVGREQDGYIDIDDFQKIVSDLMLQRDEEDEEDDDSDRRRDAFRILAEDGRITLQSLRKASQAQGEAWTIQELTEMMNEADTNHDGHIDPVEFERIWKLAGL